MELKGLAYAFMVSLVLIAGGCVPPGTEGGEGGGSPFAAFIPFILIFVLFYFLIIRPQRRQEHRRREMLENVKRGDSVLTSGGIYGKVVNVEGDELTVEIAKGVNVRMSRAGIASLEAKRSEKGEGGKKS